MSLAFAVIQVPMNAFAIVVSTKAALTMPKVPQQGYAGQQSYYVVYQAPARQAPQVPQQPQVGQPPAAGAAAATWVPAA